MKEGIDAPLRSQKERLKNCPYHELNFRECFIAMNAGFQRAHKYINEIYSEELNSEEYSDIINSHSIGTAGEMIVCSYYDAEFDNKIQKYGDWGHDAIIGDYRVQIKATTNSQPKLTVSKDKVYADVFLLVYVYEEDELVPYRGYEEDELVPYRGYEEDELVPYRGKILGYLTKKELKSFNTTIYFGEESYVIDWQGLNLPPKNQ